MVSAETVTTALRQIPLFSGLSQDQLAVLATHTIRQQLPRGYVIFNRGDVGDRAYVILRGSIDLVIESPDGRELILARLGTGEQFGEMALVDDLERSAGARTAEPTDVLVVPREAFLTAMVQEPAVSMQIIRSLVQRLRAADEKIEAFAYLDAEGRLARTLLDLDHGRGDTHHMTHEELANMAATSRQTTTRILNEWQERGYVDLSRRGIQVKDAEALGLLAGL